MPNPEEDKKKNPDENKTELSFEILLEENKKLNSRIEALEKSLKDTQNVVKSNFTSSVQSEPKKSDNEAHEKLKKKLYSNLKIKSE